MFVHIVSGVQGAVSVASLTPDSVNPTCRDEFAKNPTYVQFTVLEKFDSLVITAGASGLHQAHDLGS